MFLMVFGLGLLVLSRKLGKAANGYWGRFAGREMGFEGAYTIAFVIIGLFFVTFATLNLSGLIRFGGQVP